MIQQTQHSSITAGVEQYYSAKPEGDIDLVVSVRQLLIEAGLLQLVEANYDKNKFILEASNRPSSVQRFLLNRFWNYQLVSCDAVSIDERYCLIPNGTVQDWLKLFTEKVLPFAISNQLPKGV